MSIEMDRVETCFGKSEMITGVRESVDGIDLCIERVGMEQNQMTEKMASLLHELLALQTMLIA